MLPLFFSGSRSLFLASRSSSFSSFFSSPSLSSLSLLSFPSLFPFLFPRSFPFSCALFHESRSLFRASPSSSFSSLFYSPSLLLFYLSLSLPLSLSLFLVLFRSFPFSFALYSSSPCPICSAIAPKCCADSRASSAHRGSAQRQQRPCRFRAFFPAQIRPGGALVPLSFFAREKKVEPFLARGARAASVSRFLARRSYVKIDSR